MHSDEIAIDAALVQRLIAAQFPHWTALPVQYVPSSGTDNAMFRLGDDKVVRLPRIPSAAGQIEKELRWLPFIAPQVPLTIPIPQGAGIPTADYPFQWGIYGWLDGENATLERLQNPLDAAHSLARFLRALQTIHTHDAPAPGAHNFYRGVPLAMRDESTRNAIDQCAGLIDVGAARAAWQSALNAPIWDKPPVWIHGDLQSGNLLAVDGKLSAVIDFGGLGVGDPAVELLVAWTLFPPDARKAFRKAMQVDDATWARGKGWALSFGVIALPYYLHTNPTLAGIAQRAINAVLADSPDGNSVYDEKS